MILINIPGLSNFNKKKKKLCRNRIQKIVLTSKMYIILLETI